MGNYEKLNYSALSDKTIRRKDFTDEQLKLAGLGGVVGMIAAGVFSILGIGIFVVGLAGTVLSSLGDTSTLLNMWQNMLLAGAIILLVLSLMLLFQTRENRRRFRLLKFALDNNATYIVARQSPPSEPIMFNIGHTRLQSETIIFHDGATLAKYQYTTGSGKNQQTHQFNFMQIKLPRAVPHLFINSKKNAVNPDTFEYQVQKIKLEGDFTKHFDVLAPPNYHVDTLQILTPDVMAALIDYGQNYDFELIGDSLYIYQGGLFRGTPMDSAEDMKQFLAAAEQITTQFGHQAKRYSDTRAGNVASGLVAEQGARFKRRKIGWISVAASLATILFYLLLEFLW
jgi:hypothetical protein